MDVEPTSVCVRACVCDSPLWRCPLGEEAAFVHPGLLPKRHGRCAKGAASHKKSPTETARCGLRFRRGQMVWAPAQRNAFLAPYKRGFLLSVPRFAALGAQDGGPPKLWENSN